MTLMVGTASADLTAWSEAYKLTFPVMWDDWSLYGDWNSPGTPIQHLIGPGSEIIKVNTRFSEAQLEEYLGI